ncbi:MAG TPA: polysaccharide biosynthesis tyrosine autokinase [Acidobacteriaceae bacterium]|jgi:capsular exopolysaccharide synthesis family protein
MVDAPHQVSPITVESEGPLGSSSAKDGLSLSDIGRILLKWKWLIVACLLISLLLGYVYSKTRIPMYEGTATIDLNPSQTNMGLSDLIQESLSSEDVRIPTEVARMQSNLVVFLTIKELAQEHRGPFPHAFDHMPDNAGVESFPPAQLQGMIGSVRGSLRVAAITGTDIIAIAYVDPRPQVAKDVPNTIVEVYLKRNLDEHMEGTGRVTRWLASEMEGLKQEATDAQARLGQYQREHNLIQIGGGGAGQTDSLELDRLRVSNDQLAAAQADHIVHEAKLRLAESNDPDLIATVAPSSTLMSLRAELLSLSAQYNQLTTKFGLNYPRVRELHNQIASVQHQVDTEMRNVQQRIREEYNTSTHTLDLMQGQLDKQMQDAYKLNESASQYALLRQDAESSRELYDQLQLKLKESNLAAGLNTASITVIDDAMLPLAPFSPDVHANVTIAAGLGLLVGVLGAFIFDSLDDTLRTTDDVELFSGLLSIGAIPHFQAARSGRSEELGEEPGERRRLISITAPASPTAEAYRALRSSILLSAIDNPLRTLVITSAFMSEGKSTLAANVAVMLAQRGERVLIVDADLRRSTLHLLFGLRRPAQGLTNLLSRQSDDSVILHPVAQVPSLAYLPAGAVPPNPAELLASHRMAEMMRQWGEQYDRVIIDTAPILAVSDSLAPAARADSVLLVVRAGMTRKKALMRTRELLRRVNAHLLGAVVNDIDMRKDSYYDYSGPYTYGYGYTSESIHEEVK